MNLVWAFSPFSKILPSRLFRGGIYSPPPPIITHLYETLTMIGQVNSKFRPLLNCIALEVKYYSFQNILFLEKIQFSHFLKIWLYDKSARVMNLHVFTSIISWNSHFDRKFGGFQQWNISLINAKKLKFYHNTLEIFFCPVLCIILAGIAELWILMYGMTRITVWLWLTCLMSTNDHAFIVSQTYCL
jgi:hypothetical protein